MTALDDFTLGLLTSDEVLEVNQDPLGAPVSLLRQNDTRIWSKKLEDRGLAVGLFSFGSMDGRVKADFAGLGLENTQRVRDLWQQQERGVFMSAFEAVVPSHGVVLVRLTAK